MRDIGICVAIHVNGYECDKKFYKRSTLLSEFRTKAVKKLKLKPNDFVLHSKGQNRALVDFDDVVHDVVSGEAVTLGQLTEKHYGKDTLLLDFVELESVKRVKAEEMARWVASGALVGAAGAAGGAAAPPEAGSKRKFGIVIDSDSD